VTKFSTPTYGQNALTNVAAGTSNDFAATPVVVLDTTSAGTFPQIGTGAEVPATTSAPTKNESSTMSLSAALFLVLAISALF
jgi:hypothetical protein